MVSYDTAGKKISEINVIIRPDGGTVTTSTIYSNDRVVSQHIATRDTFAVELLLAGVPIERVSVLLGHRSVKITDNHYNPWVRSRQEQLEADVQRAWSRDPIALLETKGTQRVREKNEAVN